MERRRRVTLGGIWGGVYPMLAYTCIQTAAGGIYAVVLAVSTLLLDTGHPDDVEQYILDRAAEHTMTILLLSMVLAIPLFAWLYFRDVQKKKRAGWNEDWFPLTEGMLLWTIISGAALALFCNGLISLLPLAQWSDSYEEVSETLYSGNIWIRIMSVGFFGPAVEELVMRGLLYQRFRSMMRVGTAMFWSALVFGIFHGNLVQGVYAFLVGLFFAWLMEHSQRILVPVAGHMAANLFVLFLEDSSLLDMFYGSIMGFVGMIVLSGTVFICSFLAIKNKLS